MPDADGSRGTMQVLVKRIREWQLDDDAGYDQAIELLCAIRNELEDLLKIGPAPDADGSARNQDKPGETPLDDSVIRRERSQGGFWANRFLLEQADHAVTKDQLRQALEQIALLRARVGDTSDRADDGPHGVPV